MRVFLGRIIIGLAIVGMMTPSRGRAQAPPPPEPGHTQPFGASKPELDLPSPLTSDRSGMANPSPLTQITAQPPQPIAPFIEHLKANDASFEVVVGHGHILTTKEDITEGQNQPLVAVGDPSVIEFAILSPRQIRVTGLRIGVTDLSITTGNGRTFSFKVQVVVDLDPLAARLKAHFPDANLRLAQLRESVVVEGQARDAGQVVRIIQLINAYLKSAGFGPNRTSAGSGNQAPRAMQDVTTIQQAAANTPLSAPPDQAPIPLNGLSPSVLAPPPTIVTEETSPIGDNGGNAAYAGPEVINLIRLPGSQQVLLKVRVAELNRSALRRIGANFLGIDPRTGAIVGTQVASPASATGTAIRRLRGVATSSASADTTVFGIFQDNNFEFTLNALRHNSMLKVLAEPNLVTMHGHEASFLAGGQFPVPVPQVASGGATPTVTVQFKNFGVQLNFVPYIIDGDIIRLSVAPAVSQIDRTIATTLVAGGSPVPGLNIRQAQTTVEMLEGQTLAIAGLLQLELNGSTDRVPGLGDLPIIGPFFSNTSSERVEKELVVLVTPYLVEAMNKDQVPPTPGDEVKEPNDLELFFLNRIEGRTGKDFRATTRWDDPFHLNQVLELVPKYTSGPIGFSD